VGNVIISVHLFERLLPFPALRRLIELSALDAERIRRDLFL
jgi:hypothetical protein